MTGASMRKIRIIHQRQMETAGAPTRTPWGIPFKGAGVFRPSPKGVASASASGRDVDWGFSGEGRRSVHLPGLHAPGCFAATLHDRYRIILFTPDIR